MDQNTKLTLGSSAYSLLRQRSTLNIFQATWTYMDRGPYVPLCSVCIFLHVLYSLFPGSFQISLRCSTLQASIFQFIFVFIIPLFFVFALTVVDSNLLEYLSEHREVGKVLTAEAY